MGKNKVLINRNTGKEFPTTDSDAVLERFPKTFRVKPDVELTDDVKKAEQSILDKNLTDLKTDIDKIDDLGELNNILADEKAGKKRQGAYDVIEARRKEIQDKIDVSDVDFEDA